MKRLLLFFCFFSFAVSAETLFRDAIHEDFVEDKRSSLHSYGAMVYGGHNNTFHLRQFFIRYNHQLENFQFFFTINGQKDTHEPQTNYSFLLGNINLYDYGVLFRYKNFFLSPRGAATYRANYHTYLLLPPYYFANNLAEFDAPSQFIPIFLTGPGVRLGYQSEKLEIAYSQGDFRHSIPMALMARWADERYYIRGIIQLHNADPVFYRDDLWRARGQISGAVSFPVGNKLTLSLLGEVTKEPGAWWLRAEQSLSYREYSLGLREIARTNQPLLFEASLQRQFGDYFSFGLYVATSEQFYVATKVQF